MLRQRMAGAIDTEMNGTAADWRTAYKGDVFGRSECGGDGAGTETAKVTVSFDGGGGKLTHTRTESSETIGDWNAYCDVVAVCCEL